MNESDVSIQFWKRGKVYYYRLPGETSFHTTKQTNKALARAYVSKVINEGKPVKKTLEQYSSDFYVWDKCQWIKRQNAKGKSFSRTMAQERRSQLTNYILPKFGNKKLNSINAVEFENWVITLSLANGTKNAIMHTLNIILREAKREGLIKNNPMDDVEPLANNYKKRDAFNPDDIGRLFPDNTEKLIEIWGSLYFVTLFYTMLTTGMRVGEITALQWKHVKLKPGAIIIAQAIKADYSIGKPKSNEMRSVILPEKTIKLLTLWKSETICKDADDFVFHGMDMKSVNKPINRSTVLHTFKKAVRTAGIDTEGRNLVVHSFRHTYNTIMRSILPEEGLHYMLGHKSRAMTDRYDQSTPEQKIDALLVHQDIINKAWQ